MMKIIKSLKSYKPVLYNANDAYIENLYSKETLYFNGYREFPRKPRPLAARMNWKNKFKIT